MKKKTSLLYRILKIGLKAGFPKYHVAGIENLPQEPSLYIGNHSQMHGPIASEFYFPVKHYTWCIGQVMDWKEAPSYIFHDMASFKPKCTHWFYRLLGYLITPLSVLVFKNADTIAVYKDGRLRCTIKRTLEILDQNISVLIFPEEDKPFNHILCDFQRRFVDIARYHYRKTGKELLFVPTYLAPRLRTIFIGKPIRYDAKRPIEEERERLCHYLMEQITEIAVNQPEHTVIPYLNISKKNYPSNLSK